MLVLIYKYIFVHINRKERKKERKGEEEGTRERSNSAPPQVGAWAMSWVGTSRAAELTPRRVMIPGSRSCRGGAADGFLVPDAVPLGASSAGRRTPALAANTLTNGDNEEEKERQGGNNDEVERADHRAPESGFNGGAGTDPQRYYHQGGNSKPVNGNGRVSKTRFGELMNIDLRELGDGGEEVRELGLYSSDLKDNRTEGFQRNSIDGMKFKVSNMATIGSDYWSRGMAGQGLGYNVLRNNRMNSSYSNAAYCGGMIPGEIASSVAESRKRPRPPTLGNRHFSGEEAGFDSTVAGSVGSTGFAGSRGVSEESFAPQIVRRAIKKKSIPLTKKSTLASQSTHHRKRKLEDQQKVTREEEEREEGEDDDDDDNDNEDGDGDGEEDDTHTINSVSRKVKQERLVNRRNAEACRRQRQKRKANEDNLRRQHRELEASRELFLKRIAELQFEVDTLCMADSIDLRKENELLRMEIAKHKEFIQELLDTVHRQPSVLMEEQVRVLKGVADRAVSQVVGMVHTSANWRKVHVIRHESMLEMHIYCELLPRKVPINEVKRINMRCEVLFAPASSQTLHRVLASEWASGEIMQSFCAPWLVPPGPAWAVSSLNSRQVNHAMMALAKDKLRVYSWEEQTHGQITFKASLASCTAARELVPSAFMVQHDEHERRDQALAFVDEGLVRCRVHAAMTCDEALAKADIKTLSSSKSKCIYGYTIVPTTTNPASSHIITVSSLPVGEFSKLRKTSDMFSEDGSLTETFVRVFQTQLDFFANVQQPCADPRFV